MKHPKRSQYEYAKSPYRIRNWPEYEAGLRRRGDLTIWFSDNAIKSWRAPTGGQPGGQPIYGNIAIETALTIRMVIRLPPIHLLIDSTGLRIHVGNLRKPPKKRAWRKLHFAVDANTGEIVASDLTSSLTYDCARVPVLLEQIDNRVTSVSADGAYDAEKERNQNIRSIRGLGRREWHKRSGYSERSMVENTIYRYRTIIGRRMTSRTLPHGCLSNPADPCYGFAPDS